MTVSGGPRRSAAKALRLMMDRRIWMFRSGKQSLLNVTLVACLLVIALVAAPGISAQDEPIRLAIVPVGTEGSYFDLTMEPGETRELSVQLSNRGSTTVSARTYPADAYTIVNGGFGARLADEPISGTTHWIDYRDETLDLEPRETVTRSFAVSVPAGTDPGQYLTSLVIQNAEPIGGDGGEGVGFNQVIRQTVAVAIRIPGPDGPALQIGQASHAMVAGTSVISIEVMNAGNVHLVPYGVFTLTDSEGAEVARLRLQMATVYAKTSTLVEAPLPMLLEAGEYAANLTLQDDTYDVRAESGPLPLSVPVLDVPQQVALPETVADPPVQPAGGTRTIVIPAWALLVAIPAAVLLGVLLALGIFLGLRRRFTPKRDIVTHETPPPARKPATIRPLIPPSRRTDLKGDSG